MKIKVFIVDDHYMVIEGLRSLLQNEPDIECIGHAMNAASGMAFLQQQLPDVILMDINLPDKNGIDLCKDVREKHKSVYVIGLSTFNQQSFIQRMIDNGASGYVLKNVGQNELLQAIRTVSKGKTWYSEEVSQILKNNKIDKPILTRREREVLELIAQGFTNNEVAEKLFVSTTTVDTHRKNLLEKLQANNTASLVRQAFYYDLLAIDKS